ncbi:hypothetical protein ACGU38_07600, partial [Streptomyces rochei]
MDELSTGVALGFLGAASWLAVSGRQAALRRARTVLAGGGSAGTGPPPGRRLADGLRRVRGRVRPEWSALAAGLVLAALGGS